MSKPAIDPTQANPLWLFVVKGKEHVEIRLKDEHISAEVRASLEHELQCWIALIALVDRWLKGKENASS